MKKKLKSKERIRLIRIERKCDAILRVLQQRDFYGKRCLLESIENLERATEVLTKCKGRGEHE